MNEIGLSLGSIHYDLGDGKLEGGFNIFLGIPVGGHF